VACQITPILMVIVSQWGDHPRLFFNQKA